MTFWPGHIVSARIRISSGKDWLIVIMTCTKSTRAGRCSIVGSIRRSFYAAKRWFVRRTAGAPAAAAACGIGEADAGADGTGGAGENIPNPQPRPCQALTAAPILAKTGDPTHFGQETSYARFCGVAPREASSGTQVRHRMDQRSTRQLDAALHCIAVKRARILGSASQRYLERWLREGTSGRAALQALKRHLARSIFGTIKRHLASEST